MRESFFKLEKPLKNYIRFWLLLFTVCLFIFSVAGQNQIIYERYLYEPGGRIGAMCMDGIRSSATGRGACSHHGGVAQWIESEFRQREIATTFLARNYGKFRFFSCFFSLILFLRLAIVYTDWADEGKPKQITKKRRDDKYWAQRNYHSRKKHR